MLKAIDFIKSGLKIFPNDVVPMVDIWENI